jgi:putative PIN family toxin of toxin-antitoxin system
MRIVIDTIVFVSGLMLPSSVPGRLLAAAIAGDFEIVLCEAMLEEISAALHYPKVRKRISLSDDELDRYVQALRFTADVVDPAGVDVQVPKDRDDDVILATLIVAKADWLITSDAALLALRDRYPIIAPSEFAARHLG